MLRRDETVLQEIQNGGEAGDGEGQREALRIEDSKRDKFYGEIDLKPAVEKHWEKKKGLSGNDGNEKVIRTFRQPRNSSLFLVLQKTQKRGGKTFLAGFTHQSFEGKNQQPAG